VVAAAFMSMATCSPPAAGGGYGIGDKIRPRAPIRPRTRASEWNGRRLSLVSSTSPKGRDKVAGGNAPGKRAPNKVRSRRRGMESGWFNAGLASRGSG